MTICHTTDATFQTDLQREGFTLVNFWATWCAPCRRLSPILEVYNAEQPEIRMLKVNVEQCQIFSAQFEIMSVPTTILFKDGQEIDRVIGLLSIEALNQFVSNHK